MERIYHFSFAVIRKLNLTSHTVGQGLAPAEEINENRTAFGYYRFEKIMLP